MSIIKGALYVVATPLGHLGDVSQRSLQTLSGVDVIAAEDTRRSAQLLRHFGIDAPCVALHEHNERDGAPRLVRRLQAGDAVALVSDAGTPLISDPGYHLVRAAQDAGCRVVPVPGPSALVAALSVSGLPADAVAFEGFLPAKAAARAPAGGAARRAAHDGVLRGPAPRPGDAGGNGGRPGCRARGDLCA